MLTERSRATPLPEQVLRCIDAVVAAECSRRTLVSASDLPRLSNAVSPLNRVSLWRGDITTLRCSAIVNAANSQMLGCFRHEHLCIDNVIHAAAGPRLRAYRRTISSGVEPTGGCKITPAYSLPSSYVLHTVGPNLQAKAKAATKAPTPSQRAELASCYRSCLEAAHVQGDISSIAFCCISTGLFGYPADEAAVVAVSTVLEWLHEHRSSAVQHVIFDVFTAQDERLYRAELQRVASMDALLPPSSLSPTSSFSSSS